MLRVVDEAEWLAWLAEQEGPLGYLVIALAAFVEYVFPPLPGDTIALAGATLAASAGWSAWGVYAALNAGSIIGGMGAYGLGRAIPEPARWPRWLRSPVAERALDDVRARFAKHGAIVLAANRFVPALRAFFFVGAGLARLHPLAVLAWGALSALAWNAILVGLALALEASLPRLMSGMRVYSWVVGGALVVAIAAWLWRRRALSGSRGDARRAPPP